ncbi:MAG: mandelate racemase/muconate lactonizing enzyme family protein [Stappiaceae bacterium]
MKISDISITHHRLPLDPPFHASWDTKPRTQFDATIVRVQTDEGLVGIGSGDRMIGFEGHEELFIGQDPMRLERHYRILSNINFHYGRCWPLDLALWDLCGKITGQPVWKLLGGNADRIRAYASSGTLRSPTEMADFAADISAQGFKAMKVRFHRAVWQDDVAIVRAIRERVGSTLELMVDCNQGWRMPWDTKSPWTYKDALAVARALEKLNVYWMEEPLFRADRDNMRLLREATDIRIAGGEMNREVSEFKDLIAAGSLDIVQPDAALVGGITGLRRVAVLAEENGILFTPHTWTNGIGLLANAHLTAGISNAPFLEFPYDEPAWSLDRRDYMLASPTSIDDGGFLTLSDAPGLGIVLNEDTLAATLIT